MPQEAKPNLTPEQLAQLYAAAKQALNDPAGPGMMEVNAAILQRTGGKYPGFASLALDFDPKAEVGPGFADQVAQYDRAKANAHSSPMSGLEAAAYGAQDMAAFGFADEAEGALQGVVEAGGEVLRTPLERIGLVLDNERGPRQAFTDTYAAQRDAMRSGLGQAREQRPGATAVGSVAGAALPAVATGGAGLLGTGGQVTRGATQPLARRVGSGLLRGAAGGGAGGAAYGAGSGEDMQRRAEMALQTGAIGVGVGGLLGVALPVAGHYVSGRLANRAVVDPRVSGTASPAAAKKALKLIDAGLDMSGMSADDAVARARKMGPNASLADVDEVLAAQAGAAREMGPGLRKAGGVAEKIGDRNKQTGERITEFLKKELGGMDMDESLQAAIDDRTLVRQRYFDPLEFGTAEVIADGSEFAARLPLKPGTKVPTGSQVGKVTPPAQIIGTELDDLVAKNAEVRKLVMEVQPEWRPGMKLTFREAQEVSQLSREMKYHPDLLQRPARSRRWANAADAIDGIMDEQIPGFREANKQYQRVMARYDAHELGGKMATKRPDEVKRAYDNLTMNNNGKVPNREAQDAFKLGMLDYYEGRLLKRTGTGGGSAELIDAGPEVRRRLSILFDGNDVAMERFLDAEGRFRTTQRLVNGGSQTAVKQEIKAILDKSPNLSASKWTIVNKALALVRDGRVRREAAEIAGEVLLTQGEEGLQQFIRLINMRSDGMTKIGQSMSNVTLPGMAGASAYISSGGGLLGSGK